MLYSVSHRTIYDYDQDVVLSHHLLRLTPRPLDGQICHEHGIETSPQPATLSEHTDHFGNPACFVTVEGAHRQLQIFSRSRVEVLPHAVAVAPQATPPWEIVRDQCSAANARPPVEPTEFVFASPLIPRRDEFADYARPSFSAGRPILAGARDLCARLHADFRFDARATTVMTTVNEFFKTRRGVCQDFAHLMIGCLRSLGLPARYVSGYLETKPLPGQPRLVGADASHAWASLWCGEAGWVDLDPTNNLLPSDRHVTIAWGRDFGDVSPARGVLVGSGSHQLRVSVDVMPLSEGMHSSGEKDESTENAWQLKRDARPESVEWRLK
jgi:transglutaminase-like putative cysteine protease